MTDETGTERIRRVRDEIMTQTRRLPRVDSNGVPTREDVVTDLSGTDTAVRRYGAEGDQPHEQTRVYDGSRGVTYFGVDYSGDAA